MSQARRTDKPDEPNWNKYATWAAGRKLSGAGGRLPTCYWAACSGIEIVLLRTGNFQISVHCAVKNLMMILILKSYNILLTLKVVYL